MFDHSQATCWVVTDGKAGMENQCLGLAEALGLSPVVKRLRLRTPWRQFIPYLRLGLQWAFSPEGDPIEPPWPDLLIGTGRQSIAASLYVRGMSRKNGAARTFTVHIQNPVISPSHFDLVIAPRHDNLAGPNVMTTRGSLHRITPEKLRREAVRFMPRVAALPRPYLGVLIGGTSSAYTLTPADMIPLAAQLAGLSKSTGGSLIVTPSRRTGEDNVAVLRDALGDVPHFLWDMKTGENPYFGILGVSDAFFVTADSANLVSEACSTGKPVHILELPGGSEKFRRFHQSMRDEGFTRPFRGVLESWAYEPLDDMKAAAGRVRAMMGLQLPSA